MQDRVFASRLIKLYQQRAEIRDKKPRLVLNNIDGSPICSRLISKNFRLPKNKKSLDKS